MKILLYSLSVWDKPSFFLICTYIHTGGITGAGARITGAVGDVFAKLTFDSDFVDKRQLQRSQPPKLGRKFGNFAKVGITMIYSETCSMC